MSAANTWSFGNGQAGRMVIGYDCTGVVFTFMAEVATTGTIQFRVNGVAQETMTLSATTNKTQAANVSLVEGDIVDFYMSAYTAGSNGTAGMALRSGAVPNALVNDTTPDLGGNLTLSGFDIVGTGDINITGAISATSFTGSFIGDGSGLTFSTSYDYQYIDSAAMVANTTSGATIGTRELPTNDVMLDYIAFDSESTEYSQFKLTLPEKIIADPTIRFKFHWTAESGSGDVVWGIQNRITSNDDAIDGAWSTGSTATADALITANDHHITDGSANLTLTGLAGSDMIWFRIYRDVATDSLTADAQLIGIEIQYPINNTATTVWS
jgi:hypothetical protein